VTCSDGIIVFGTVVFDSVVKTIVSFTYPDDMQYQQIVSLINTLEQQGWCGLGESAYLTHPIVAKAVCAVHPVWCVGEIK
jgi:hypothetical protein